MTHAVGRARRGLRGRARDLGADGEGRARWPPPSGGWRPTRRPPASPSCPASCASARSASAGRRCASCPAPAAEPSLDGRRASTPRSSAIGAARRARARRRGGAPRSPRCSPARPSPSSASCAALLTRRAAPGRAQAGVMVDAVARAADVPRDRGAPRADAARRPRRGGRRRARRRRRGAARRSGSQVGRPLQPMLAAPAADVADALERIAPGGGGVQARRRARAGPPPRRRGRASSRAASTTSPRACPRSSRPRSRCPRAALVLDGEVIALRADGRPQPFQVTASRLGSRRAAPSCAPCRSPPLFFDVLHVDGEDLLDRPGAERFDGAGRARARGAARAARRRRRRRGRRGDPRRRARAAATRASWSSRSTRPTRPGGAAPAG